MTLFSTRLLPVLLIAILGAAASALAESVPVRVDRDICARVVEHVPEPSVAYQPGGDVAGRPVASADLPGSFQMVPPDDFVVILDITFRRRHLNGPRRLEATVPLGLLTVRDGRVYYDGQPLGDPEQASLAAACRDFLKRGR